MAARNILLLQYLFFAFKWQIFWTTLFKRHTFRSPRPCIFTFLPVSDLTAIPPLRINIDGQFITGGGIMIQFANLRSFKDRYSRSFVGGSTVPVYSNIRLYPGLASFKATNPSASYFLCRLLSGQLTTVFYFVRIQSEESIKTRIIDGVILHSKTAHLCSDYLIETFIPLFPFWVIVAQLKIIEWMNFSTGL